MDRPTVTPLERAVDPLEDYFDSGLFGFIGGGISRTPPVLGQDPVSVSLLLNEHVRFERPGRFRLFVMSGRVHPVDEFSPLPVTSNAVDVEILPADPSWERRQIAGSVATLRDGGDGTELAPCRVLRFLGTPDYPVRARFLRNLAFLNWLTRHPDHTASAGTPVASPEVRRNAHDASVDESFEDLADALATKEGLALAISAMTLIGHVRSGGPESLPPAVEAQRSRLPAVFDLLTEEEQLSLLDYDWRAIRHRGLLPVLRRILDQPPTGPARREPVRDAALRRLYELAPAEGRRRILRKIRSGDSTMDAATLGMLPDATLPELEHELMTRLETAPDEDLTGELLARYASAAVLPRMVRWLRANLGERACRPLHALLAYAVRLNPDEGLPLVREALSRRARTGCYETVLQEVAALHADPGLAALAMEALEDANHQVVQSAARTLQDHGTAEARDALWNQLTRRYAQAVNQGRNPADKRLRELSWSGWRTQQILAHALAEGQGWRLELADLSRLRDHVHDATKVELTVRLLAPGRTVLQGRTSLPQ